LYLTEKIEFDMKKILTYFAVIALIGMSEIADAQGIYFDPEPTNVFEPVRLYIDISSSDCNCPELQDAAPETNPLYIWTWNPNEARDPITIDGQTFDITNGEWGVSNENLVMTQDESNPNLWYYDFLGAPMVQFYNVPAATFYATGINFLIKEKNGAPADQPEQKSGDLSAIPEPVGCVNVLCLFPTIWFPSEYLTLTYNNNIETNPGLQNLGPDEVLVYFRYKVNGGPFITYQVPSEAQLTFEGGGFFTKTIIPKQLFGIPDGDELTELQVFVTKTPLIAPPFSIFTLNPGCP